MDTIAINITNTPHHSMMAVGTITNRFIVQSAILVSIVSFDAL